jgi:hypothetical protein
MLEVLVLNSMTMVAAGREEVPVELVSTVRPVSSETVPTDALCLALNTAGVEEAA